MLQMPLARRALTGEPARVVGDVDLDGTCFDTDIMRQAVSENPLFNIQLAHDLCARKEGFAKQREVLKPPYPMMWMEWNSLTQVRETPRELNVGCLVVDTDPTYLKDGVPDDLNDLAGKVLTMFYLGLPDGGWLNLASGYVLELDDYGRFIQEQLLFSPDSYPKGLQGDHETLMFNYLVTVGVALSLINCKNVSTAATGKLSIGRSGRQKRNGASPKSVQYHTIVLPGGGTESDGKGGHRATALHRVRGHFKTFTAERPLLGQHVGTYWWGWQVRGDANNGIVISDYQLGGKGA